MHTWLVALGPKVVHDRAELQSERGIESVDSNLVPWIERQVEIVDVLPDRRIGGNAVVENLSAALGVCTRVATLGRLLYSSRIGGRDLPQNALELPARLIESLLVELDPNSSAAERLRKFRQLVALPEHA